MRILILSPHTDDAELGCGGSIIKFLEDGHELCWVVFSTAEDSLPDGFPKDTLKKEFANVAKDLALAHENIKIFDFKVRHLHHYRQNILDDLIQIRGAFKPELVVGPSPHDLHQDHQIVAHEMTRAFKTSSGIICYELPWNHVTFDTQCFIKLREEHINSKCCLLENYKSQLTLNRPYFHRDFTFGLARTRGIQCNSDYAEAFEVIRWML
jgi:LmbE family N-acetylglucosaminyl deacetylase